MPTWSCLTTYCLTNLGNHARVNEIGTTGRGIGPTYEDKVARSGIRLGDLRNSNHLKDRISKIIEEKLSASALLWSRTKLPEFGTCTR